MKLSFPPITRSDETFLFALYASTRADEMSFVAWNDEQKTAFLQSQFEAQHLHYTSTFPLGNFQVICLETKKIGRLYVLES